MKRQHSPEPEHHDADRALQDSEERWRAIVESAVDGIVQIDSAGRIEAFNQAAERMFGYREAEVVGANVSLLMPSPHREQHDGYLARYLRSNEPHVIGRGREVSGRRRDGAVFPIHLSIAEMRIGGERKFTGIIHDLTARVRMETQLREQTAMARLGEMAGVVAHEVKNPLAAIRGALQVLESRMPAGSSDAAVAMQIMARIDGLNELVDDLLVFARPPQPRLARTALLPLIAGTVRLLKADPAMTGIEVTVTGTAPPVTVDRELFKIALGNLLTNSAQAMDGQGEIAIALADGGVDVQITVRDSGPGIPAVIRDKVFTPFFTTKARGTGLGLPTARQLIEVQAGTLDLECPENGGTLVTMTLPAAPQGTAPH